MTDLVLNNWHWERCPLCQGGTVAIQANAHSGTARSWVDATCGACGGLWRVKVPNGFTLRQTAPAPQVMTTNATTAFVERITE